MRDLCDSAKKGRACIDDLCRHNDPTLCGFSPSEYAEITGENDEPASAECFHGVHYLEDCQDCDNECGCGSGMPMEVCCGYQ